MTKCIVLGEEPKGKKKIEFTFAIDPNGTITNKGALDPMHYANLELVRSDYGAINNAPFDLMFACDNNRSEGILYLGNWNDGVV